MNNHYAVTQNIICTANNTTEMHFLRAPSLKTLLFCLGQSGSQDALWGVSSGVSFDLAAKTLFPLSFFSCLPKKCQHGTSWFCPQEARTPEVFLCFWHHYLNEEVPLFWALSESLKKNKTKEPYNCRRPDKLGQRIAPRGDSWFYSGGESIH